MRPVLIPLTPITTLSGVLCKGVFENLIRADGCSLGQMIAMVSLNPISDRIGRKWTLYALWCILFAVSLLSQLQTRRNCYG